MAKVLSGRTRDDTVDIGAAAPLNHAPELANHLG